MFPVYMKYPGSEPPKDGIYYIIAKNGILLRKKNDWIDAMVPVKQIAILDEEVPYARLLLPPLSQIVMAKAVGFFRAVYAQQRTESAVLLHYHPSQGWELSVPRQTAAPAHVKYEHEQHLDGYRCVGTMHSHAGMAAFHSGTDRADQATFDGIHITVGNMNHEDSFSIDARVFVNGNQFILDPIWIEGVAPCEQNSIREAWSWIRDHAFYTVSLSGLKEWVVPDDWIAKVGKASIYPALIQAQAPHDNRTLDPFLCPDPYDIFGPNFNQ